MSWKTYTNTLQLHSFLWQMISWKECLKRSEVFVAGEGASLLPMSSFRQEEKSAVAEKGLLKCHHHSHSQCRRPSHHSPSQCRRPSHHSPSHAADQSLPECGRTKAFIFIWAVK
ncbi:hypothetical protein GBAR_LOCUS30853 [Geodia barretti]|uniref:Uncharacterized protein n=1 Tax=Geodia barretti TaxID=519541 RepID=A0AA35U0X7_GEOBA|nr:hypothetical protein GBAR_LOCUS30853 [Geodia barretti]